MAGTPVSAWRMEHVRMRAGILMGTALIISASKIDQVSYQSTLMNIKFHPQPTDTEDLRNYRLDQDLLQPRGKHIS